MTLKKSKRCFIFRGRRIYVITDFQSIPYNVGSRKCFSGIVLLKPITKRCFGSAWQFLQEIRKNSVIISCPGIDAEKIITRKTSMIDAPLMVGIFSPLLLLPDIEMSEENLNMYCFMSLPTTSGATILKVLEIL